MSNAILSNEEVDALLNAIENGQVLVGQKAEKSKEKKIQHYDFRRPDRFPREQKRRLQKMSEEMADIIGFTLSSYLRTSVRVELIAIEELSYEIFVNSFTDIVCANVLHLKPLSGRGCLTVDVGYCLAIVDRGLGGPGKIPQKTRPLTLVEEAIIASVFTNVLDEVKASWHDLAELQWSIEKTDRDLKTLQVASSTESMISINFATNGDLGNGTIILCIPVITLEMLMMKTVVSPLEKEEEMILIRNLLQEIEVNITAVLGTTQLSFHELLKLKIGDVIKLDNRVTGDICLEIDEKPKYTGKPGIVGKKMAFKVFQADKNLKHYKEGEYGKRT
ncbi:MAG: flagellar motor switch protein FliM [Candidatus Brocadiaceae bacterium]|nr:flagellar motor switch protein FliM [Candidatus Brocadiaceae bacterium]